MSTTYSGNPSTSALDWLRFIVGDTRTGSMRLSDEEINYIIAESKTPTEQIARAYRQLATLVHNKPGKRTLGPQTEDITQSQKYYAEQALKYEKLQSYSGVPPLPVYDSDKVFSLNMMSNEEG